MTSVIERMGAYAESLEYEQIPEDAREWVKRAAIDGIACAFLGLTSTPASIVDSVAAEMGGNEQASLLGRGERTSRTGPLSPTGWRCATGTSTTSTWDQPGLRIRATTSPRSSPPPSGRGASGQDLLAALVTAYEVQLAFSDLPVEKNLWHRGWHHSVACAYASAAGSAKLLGLDEGGIAHALALAGARANTLSEIRHGPISMDKALSAPQVAANGLLAALLARQGYTGCLTLLDGHYGFGMAVAAIDDVDALVPSAGEFKSTKVSLKPYPVEGMTITMVEAALEARERYRGDPDSIDEVIVETYEEALIKPSWDELKVYPDTKETADHSFSFCVALALTAGHVTIRDFAPESLADETVVALIPKVTLRENARYTELYRQGSRPAAVRVRGSAGEAEAGVLDPKGDPRHPMTDGEIAAKFLEGATPIIGSSAERALERLFALEDEPNVADLALLLSNAENAVLRGGRR